MVPSDAGLLPFRALDDALGLTASMTEADLGLKSIPHNPLLFGILHWKNAAYPYHVILFSDLGARMSGSSLPTLFTLVLMGHCS